MHDLPSARTERVSVDRRGGVPDGRSLGGSLSGDGRFAVFYSTASDLVTGDADRDFDVFVRDRRRDRTEQVSVGGRCGRGSSVTSWDGVISDNGRLVVFSADGAGCVRDRRRDENRRTQGAGQISGDGSRLLVRSPRPLLPQDSGSIWDLYVLDLR